MIILDILFAISTVEVLAIPILALHSVSGPIDIDSELPDAFDDYDTEV